MTPSEIGLQDLKRQHPEWGPWLAVVQTILSESANRKWDTLVPARPVAQQSKVPLLAGATLALDTSSLQRILRQLLQIACRNGTPKMATLKSALTANLDSLSLFKASICQDGDRVNEIAAKVGADSEAFQAVAALVAMPFLHACNRRWATWVAGNWIEGYCPVCGTWPAFAEVRGIERSRYFRCGRCGGEWKALCLFCPYCATADHEQFVSLVPQQQSSAGHSIEACNRCLGYVKTLTTLQGSPPAKVMIDDFATIALDVAALEQGYKRPKGAGYALNVNLIENDVTGSAFV